jgi:hypothetical protein
MLNNLGDDLSAPTRHGIYQPLFSGIFNLCGSHRQQTSDKYLFQMRRVEFP